MQEIKNKINYNQERKPNKYYCLSVQWALKQHRFELCGYTRLVFFPTNNMFHRYRTVETVEG